jgi:glycerol-3-phosphate acyltransferase PlsY
VSARDLLGIGFAYALGSLCAGYYLVRWRTGQDIRRIGSASAGARNAGRLLGPGGFALVLGLDALKGGAAVVAGRQLGLGDVALAIAVVAVVIGHVLPIQLGFRGGKGVAPSIGALLAYDAWIVLGSAVIAGLAYVVGGRRVVLSGLVAYALAPVTGLALGRPAPEIVALAVLAVVVLAAHHGNIRGVLRGATAS